MKYFAMRYEVYWKWVDIFIIVKRSEFKLLFSFYVLLIFNEEEASVF